MYLHQDLHKNLNKTLLYIEYKRQMEVQNYEMTDKTKFVLKVEQHINTLMRMNEGNFRLFFKIINGFHSVI